MKRCLVVVLAFAAVMAGAWELTVTNTPVMVCGPTTAVSGPGYDFARAIAAKTQTVYSVGKLVLIDKRPHVCIVSGASGTNSAPTGYVDGLRVWGAASFLPCPQDRRAVIIQIASGSSLAVGYSRGMNATTNYTVLPYTATGPNVMIFTDDNVKSEFWAMCPTAETNSVVRVVTQ